MSPNIEKTLYIRGAAKIHIAVENRDIQLLKNCLPEELIIKDDDGETPLHYAAINEDLEICKLLITRNSQIIYIKDIENKTAYDWVKEYNKEEGSHLEICEYFNKILN